jgi:hypothetical protein
MAKYVIGAIIGVVLLLVLVYFAGMWSEEAASRFEGEDMASRDITQDETKVGKRPKKELPEPEQEPEEEPEPEPKEPPPVPEYPYKLPDEIAVTRKNLEKEIDFEIEEMPFKEAIEKLAELTGIEVRFDSPVFEGALPVSYMAEQLPAKDILLDLLFTASATYSEERDGISVALEQDTRQIDDMAALHAIDKAKWEYAQTSLMDSDYLGMHAGFQEEAKLNPAQLLNYFMLNYGVMPTKKALSISVAADEPVHTAGRKTAIRDLLKALSETGMGLPKSNLVKGGLRAIIMTADELAELNQQEEDIKRITDDFHSKPFEGILKDVQVYQIAKLLENETGVPVLVGKNAWEYRDFITLAGKGHSVKTLLDTLEELGFVNILIMDEDTRRERLFIFEKPEK